MNETRRLSLKDASAALGITESGVRARFKGGKLAGERDNQGKIWVFVPADTPPRVQAALRVHGEGAEAIFRELVDTLKQQVAMLTSERDALRANADEITRLTAQISGVEALLDAEKQMRQKAEEDAAISRAQAERLTVVLAEIHQPVESRGVSFLGFQISRKVAR